MIESVVRSLCSISTSKAAVSAAPVVVCWFYNSCSSSIFPDDQFCTLLSRRRRPRPVIS